jgi:hypothetical protein
MSFVEFSGALDAQAPSGQFVPFAGQLDSNVAQDVGYDAMGNQTGSPAPPESPGGRIAQEAGDLRDTFFTGVDQTIAAGKTLNMAAQQKQLQQTQDRLTALEQGGRGTSPEAEGLRKTIEVYTKRLPGMIGGAVEAQTDAQRGAAMTTRPAVKKVAAAKTFGEAWDAFTQAPYDVIAGVTAQSLPAMLPALIAGAVAGPYAGAATMGLSSATVEAGSSLADFAREAGVDVTDRKAVEAFFSDRKNLADAFSYAGKRAGIIGTLDAVSGSLAGKTIAPPLKSAIARQAINIPTQMGVQAGLGAAGEAGGQLATKGKIDEPGQVLMEAVGELGGAPAEVAAFGRDAANHAKAPAAVDPVAAIRAAPTVDAAIATASAVLSTRPAGATAVDNIARILGKETADVGQAAAVPAVPAETAGAGGADAAAGVGLGVGPAAAGLGAVDTRGAQPGDAAGPVPLDAGGPAAVAPAVTGNAAPQVTVNPSGTVTILGDAPAIRALLAAHGVTKVLQAKNGLMVGKSEAAAAQRALAPFVQAQPAAAPKSVVLELALQQQRAAGWNTNWPFIPAELLNADFRTLIAEDPTLPQEEKNRIFAAGEKLGVVPNGEMPAGRPAGPSFTTAEGSTYTVHEDGSTSRNKAARADPGHEGDAGPKERSSTTVYVDGDAAALSAAGLQGLGERGARVVLKDGKATLLTWNDVQRKWGAAASGRDIPVSDKPAVGLSPLELWTPRLDVPGYVAYGNMHAGNKITAITGAEGAPVESGATTQGAKDGAQSLENVSSSRQGDQRGAESSPATDRPVGNEVPSDRPAGSGAREERANAPADGQPAGGERRARVDAVSDAGRPGARGGDQSLGAGTPPVAADAAVASPTPEAVAAQPTQTPSPEGVSVSATTRDTQRPLIELRKRKSVLESLLKCLG